MKITLLLSTLATILCSVFVTNGQSDLPAYTDADAYEIYSVLLKPLGPPQNLVIQIETEDYPLPGYRDTCLTPAKGEEAIYAAVIENYRKMNKGRWRLQPKFAPAITYRLVLQADIEAIFKTGGAWKGFYKKYPNSGGYIAMSAVGFNADKTIAIVYKGSSCDFLCGRGTYHVFRKTAGTWSEIKWTGKTCAWVS